MRMPADKKPGLMRDDIFFYTWYVPAGISANVLNKYLYLFTGKKQFFRVKSFYCTVIYISINTPDEDIVISFMHLMCQILRQ